MGPLRQDRRRYISGGAPAPPHHPSCPCPDCELDSPPVWCGYCVTEGHQADDCPERPEEVF